MLDDTGRFQDAEQIYQRSLGIRYRKLGPKSYYTAFSYNNLGYFYYQHARLDDAYVYLKHARKQTKWRSPSTGAPSCSDARRGG